MNERGKIDTAPKGQLTTTIRSVADLGDLVVVFQKPGQDVQFDEFTFPAKFVLHSNF